MTHVNSTSTHAFFRRPSSLLPGLALLFSACAIPMPVQEMSNARQTIQEAKAARADILAPQHFDAAERLLEQASTDLSKGDFQTARQNALAAREEAHQARTMALSRDKE